MPDDRKTGKNALLAAAYGSKTGRFGSNMRDYWEQAHSRFPRQDPPRYCGEPMICTVCQQLMVKASMGVKRCECRHDERQRETKQAAMERRAHWLLKREFDEPDPVVIRDWAQDVTMLPPPPAHPYKINMAEFEKRWMDLNEKVTNELIYGANATTSNKEKP